MAIEIPHEVAMFLNFIGIPYPDINEDQVRELAGHVRTFADEVSGTHDAATGAIGEMGSVYQGQSYRALVASWASLSSSHMERLDELCRGVAKALEIAAEVITVVKVAVLTELAVLAAAYAAAMAATVVTSGASFALSQSLSLAARRLVKAMEEMLIGYIVAEVLGKAIEPLEDAVGDMINGVVYNTAADLLGVDTGKDGVVYIDPDEVRRYAQVLDDHADDIMKHAEKFANGVAALDFTTPVGMPPAAIGPAVQPVGPSGAPVVNVPAQPPVTPEVSATPRNWIPGSTGGSPAEDPAAAARAGGESPAGAPPKATGSPEAGSAPAAAGSAPAAHNGAPGAGTAAGSGDLRASGPAVDTAPAAAQPAESRGDRPSGVAGQDAGTVASQPVVSETAGNGPSQIGASAGQQVAQAGGTDSVRAVDDPHSAAGQAGGAGGAPAADGGGPASPWNRQSSAPGGSPGGAGNSAPAGRGRRRAADGDKPARTAGGRRRRAARPNPWSSRPAATPQPARTPWGKPAERTEPAVPAVAAEGGTAVPAVSVEGDTPAPVVSADRDQKQRPEGEAGAAAVSAVNVPRPDVAAPAVSAPVRADEGPPPRAN